MAEATLSDVVDVQKKTLNKVTVIGNILNKNIVPASMQAERDKEAGSFKEKLIGFLTRIEDGILDMATRTAKVAGFPFKIILGAIAFLIGFFTEIARQLGKLKKVLGFIKGLGGLIRGIVSGIFGAIKTALIATREAIVARVAKALAAFKESKAFKRIAGIFARIRMMVNAARLFVLNIFRTALAAFKENKAVKAMGNLFARIRMLVNAARLYVIGIFRSALAVFKENKIVKALGNVFTRIRWFVTSARNFVVGIFRTALAAFKENAVIKALGNVFTRFAGFVGQARALVVTNLSTALAAFKESRVIKGIGGIFTTMGGIIGRALGLTQAGPGKGSGIIQMLRNAVTAFRESALVKSIKGMKDILVGIVGRITSVIGGFGKVAGPVAGAAAKGVSGIFGLLSNVVSIVSKAISPFLIMMKGIGGMVAKVLWPLTIIIAAFDFMKGFRKENNWDGDPATLFDKIGMGIDEVLKGLIGLPLDLIKKCVGWIMDKMGLGTKTVIDDFTGEEIVQKSEWRKAYDAFSFSELISKLWQGLWGGIDQGITWVKELFTDPGAAIAQVWTGASNIGQWLYDNTIKGFIDWVKDLFDIDWAALGWSLLPAPLEKLFKGESRKKEITDKLAALEEAAGINQRDIENKKAIMAQKQADIDASMGGENVYTGWDKGGRQLDRISISGMEGTVENTQLILDSQLSEMEALRAELAELNKNSGEKGSLYTHDVHLEKLLQPMPAVAGALLKAFAGQGGGGGNSSVVTIVAPQTSNTTAAISQVSQMPGTSNPLTQLARTT